jgi:hypothetical protein
MRECTIRAMQRLSAWQVPRACAQHCEVIE